LDVYLAACSDNMKYVMMAHMFEAAFVLTNLSRF